MAAQGRSTGGGGAVEEVLADLWAEGEELDRLVAWLPPERWAEPTPAPGWTIAHQIAHLNWTDEQSLLALTDGEAFAEQARRSLQRPDTFVDEGARPGAALPPETLLAQWRQARVLLLETLAGVPRGQRVPWYGPSMSAAGMATARIMETWAHGEDVADALGVRRTPTARLRHVVRIGVRARDYAYALHGLTPPTEPFRVELVAPGGETWSHGPEDARERVTGDAVDFCRLVTHRLHRSDADVRADGAQAERWLGIAQAFAGPAGPGRPPGAPARLKARAQARAEARSHVRNDPRAEAPGRADRQPAQPTGGTGGHP